MMGEENMKEKYWERKRNLLPVAGDNDSDKRRIENSWRKILQEAGPDFSIDQAREAVKARIYQEKAGGANEEYVKKMEKSMRNRIDYVRKIEIAEEIKATGGIAGEIANLGWKSIADEKVTKARSFEERFTGQILEIKKDVGNWVTRQNLSEADMELVKIFIDKQLAGVVKDTVEWQNPGDKNWLKNCVVSQYQKKSWEEDVTSLCKDGLENFKRCIKNIDKFKAEDVEVEDTHTQKQDEVESLGWKKQMMERLIINKKIDWKLTAEIAVILVGTGLYLAGKLIGNRAESTDNPPTIEFKDKDLQFLSLEVNKNEFDFRDELPKGRNRPVPMVKLTVNREEPKPVGVVTKPTDTIKEVKVEEKTAERFMVGPLDLSKDMIFEWPEEMVKNAGMKDSVFDAKVKANDRVSGPGEWGKWFNEWWVAKNRMFIIGTS